MTSTGLNPELALPEHVSRKVKGIGIKHRWYIKKGRGSNVMSILRPRLSRIKKTRSGAYFISIPQLLDRYKQILEHRSPATQVGSETAASRVALMKLIRSRTAYERLQNIVEDRRDRAREKMLRKQPINNNDVVESDSELCVLQWPKFLRPKKGEMSLRKFHFRRSCSHLRFSHRHPLESCSGEKIFAKIMGENFEAALPCLPALKEILEKFALSHKNFQYFHVIDNIYSSEKLEYLSVKALIKYFSIIMFTVVPKQLFGYRGNTKTVRKYVIEYLRSHKRRYFSCQPIAQNVNLMRIEWLAVVENKMKRIVFTKLLEWFFLSYIQTICKVYLFALQSAYSSERLFLPRHVWDKKTTDFRLGLIRSGILRSMESNNCGNFSPVPDAFLKLFPKTTGLRTIYVSFPNEEQKNKLSILKILLRQLCMRFESPKVQQLNKLWRPFTQNKRTDKKPIYFVSCDVRDAFGSILQGKLLEILDKLLDDLPQKLTCRWYRILNPRRPIHYKVQRNFVHQSLPFAVSKFRLFSSKPTCADITVLKEEIKGQLRCYVKDQMIVASEKQYKLVQGVAQGLPLSGRFAELYYGTMMKEELGEFTQYGTLVRFVDDFLYITRDRDAANRFLTRVEKGIDGYNCYFNPSKTHTNLPPKSENEFVFLGYHFDIITGEVRPDYSEKPSRYNMNLNVPTGTQEARLFQTRMWNFSALKLEPIVLDKVINSIDRITENVLGAVRYSAQRCFVLSLYMLDIEFINAIMVVDVINKVIKRILKILRGRCKLNRLDIHSIAIFMWTIYKEEFSKNIQLHQKVGLLVDKKLKILKNMTLRPRKRRRKQATFTPKKHQKAGRVSNRVSQ